MLQEMKKRIRNEKGLTLIELLAVIVILAIIAAIAIPAIGNIINNSRDKAILSEALNVMSGAKIAHMDRQCTANSCSGSQLASYVDGVSAADLNGVTVSLNSTNEWQITYPRFSGITTGSKYHLGTGNGPYTESVIKKKLDPDAPATTPPTTP